MRLICLVPLALAACSPATKVLDLDRIYTVKEFNAAPALRERVVAFCSNLPSDRRFDPNCVNAVEAARQASAGAGDFPKISRASPW